MNVRQIVKIKGCTPEEVHAEAKRLGLAITAENDVVHPDSRAAEAKRNPPKKGKIPPKPEETLPAQLAKEVQEASRLNPSWSHGELASEFGIPEQRIVEILSSE